jgi:hypothetical protein
MIKNKTEHKTELVIDLTGPDGNAFALIGYAGNLCKHLGLDKQPIIFEMTSGDYEHLVETFDKHFGEFVTLLR